jgi:hypothetical protein
LTPGFPWLGNGSRDEGIEFRRCAEGVRDEAGRGSNASGGQDDVYRTALPNDPADIAFHHFASAIYSETEWEMVMDAVSRSAIGVLVQGGEEYGSHYIYLDTRPQLGHIIEFIWRSPAGAGGGAGTT